MKRAFFVRFLLVFSLVFGFSAVLGAAETRQPITVNGDTVEFKSEGKEVVAEGNVEIIYQDSRMTADKVRVFIYEKLAIAEGNVAFSRGTGEEFQGDMITYDFANQTGTIIHPDVKMPPYFGKAQLMEKLSETEFLINKTEISTCDLPHPHYKLTCREVRMDPGQTLKAKGVKLTLLDIPLLYVPYYAQKITDKRPRLMITPGYRKNYGMQLFGSWRYYLNENAQGRIHVDWYQKKGWAQGIDLNYDTKVLGLGNVKYYRIDEEDTRLDIDESLRRSGERSRIEMRHRWDPTDRDHVVLEYFRQSDPDFRKDYFYREFEKVAIPESFFLWSHVFPNATLSFLGQPRVNRFETVLQKLPELKLETVNQKIGSTPFYYKNTTVATQLSQAQANVGQTTDVGRIDTSNQMAYIFRLLGMDFSPFIGHRDTYYARGTDGTDEFVRSMWFSGIDISTKLFKVYDVKTDVWRLNIDKVRHVVTPFVKYRYQHEPTTRISRILQLDETDALDRDNSVTFGIENKLQTKRGGASVDLLRLILSADYNIQDNDTEQKGFQIFRYDLEFKPYEWWEFDSDAEFDTQGQFFKNINADFWAHFTEKTSANLGYRFKKDESSQLTLGAAHQINPFWKLGVYGRFEFKTGDLVEQEYRLERDMHCWTMEIIINRRETEGITFLIGFKLKAFPDIGINAEKTFSPPRNT